MYCFEAASTSGCIAVEPAAVMLPAWQLAAPLPPAATLPDAPPPVGAVAGAAELPAELHAASAIDAAATSAPSRRMDVCKDALPKIAAVVSRAAGSFCVRHQGRGGRSTGGLYSVNAALNATRE